MKCDRGEREMRETVLYEGQEVEIKKPEEEIRLEATYMKGKETKNER